MPLLLLSILLPSFALGAPLRCRNLESIESQNFPEVLELSPAAREFSLRVKEKGSDNAAVARQGGSYFANRVAKSEEARHGLPTFYVSDNPEGDRFGNELRDTATYLFLEPSVLEGHSGKIRLWLHYRGDGFQGEEKNSYACNEVP